jgi:hypothetical protein
MDDLQLQPHHVTHLPLGEHLSLLDIQRVPQVQFQIQVKGIMWVGARRRAEAVAYQKLPRRLGTIRHKHLQRNV